MSGGWPFSSPCVCECGLPQHPAPLLATLLNPSNHMEGMTPLPSAPHHMDRPQEWVVWFSHAMGFSGWVCYVGGDFARKNAFAQAMTGYPNTECLLWKAQPLEIEQQDVIMTSSAVFALKGLQWEMSHILAHLCIHWLCIWPYWNFPLYALIIYIKTKCFFVVVFPLHHLATPVSHCRLFSSCLRRPSISVSWARQRRQMPTACSAGRWGQSISSAKPWAQLRSWPSTSWAPATRYLPHTNIWSEGTRLVWRWILHTLQLSTLNGTQVDFFSVFFRSGF